MQGSARTLLGTFQIEGRSLVFRLRIDGDDRIDLGSGLVVGSDAIEIKLDQCRACERP